MKRISELDLDNIYFHTKELWGGLEGKSVFITGATGFFGKWMLESLLHINKKLSLNMRITALSRDPDRFLKEYPFYVQESSITFIKGDIQSFEFPKEKFNYIIHAATDADAKLNSENPLEMIDTIIQGTRHILEFATAQPLASFMLTSSGAIYGNQTPQVTHTSENDSFHININDPSVAYAEGKRIAELLCSTYHHSVKLPVKIARCFAFVGPYLPLNKHFAIGNFISNGLNGEDIVIRGDGTPFRSYMYASDLIIWLWTILIKGKDNEPYNVGSDQALSIEQTAAEVASQFEGITYKILTVPSGLPAARYVPSIKKAESDLGLRITIDIKEAINRTKIFHTQL